MLVPAGLLLAGTMSGWPGELTASLVTALGCLTLGAGLVRLRPAPPAASLTWTAVVGLVAYWYGSARAGWIGVAGAVLLTGTLVPLAVGNRS
jgi:hypothetical protein